MAMQNIAEYSPITSEMVLNTVKVRWIAFNFWNKRPHLIYTL